MEKKFLIAVVSLGCLTLAAFAYAQTAVPPTVPVAAPATPAVPPVKSADKPLEVVQFNTHKQKLLDDLGQHIAKMQKKQACIQVAADESALGSCLSGGNESSHPAGGIKTAPPQPAPASPVKQ